MIHQHTDGSYSIAEDDTGDKLTIDLPRHHGTVMVRMIDRHGLLMGNIILDFEELLQAIKGVRDGYVKQLNKF